MTYPLSRWHQFQAALFSMAVHAALVGVLVLSVGWHGWRLPVEMGKAGDLTPLDGFTVVLTPSDARQYTPSSEALAVKEAMRADQPSEASDAALKPEPADTHSTEPASGLGAQPVQTELAETARSAVQEAEEQQATGTPDAEQADGDESALFSRYQTAFRQNLALRWTGDLPTESAECRLLVSQLDHGQLVDVVFLDCPISAESRQQIVRALDKSVALPYQGFERVIRSPMELVVCFPALVGC